MQHLKKPNACRLRTTQLLAVLLMKEQHKAN
jgi:hypothetical protein